jgi:RNA polymerase sigma factor (sigma-70 family)
MEKNFADYTDAQIWQAFRDGNEEAFAYIYTSNAPLLYNYGRHMVNDPHLIEDCLHDLFVHIHTNRKTLGPTDAIKFYLFRSLRRRVTESVRRQLNYSKEVSPEQDYNFEVVLSPEQQIISDQSNFLQDSQLTEALNLLPKRQREALYLLYYNGLSYKEIAVIMDAEVRTVYNQVHNALNNLKKHFHPAILLLASLPAYAE